MVKDHSDSEKGEREMFYLTTHSTHFIYGYMGVRERNVLLNDALNTFYLRLYGVRHMVKDHSDSEKGEREMFYLTTHSTHFIYSYMASDHSDSDKGERERNVLFNDALNTFYLRLYGIRHMVIDHSDSEKGNPLLLSINSKGSFICTIPQTG